MCFKPFKSVPPFNTKALTVSTVIFDGGAWNLVSGRVHVCGRGSEPADGCDISGAGTDDSKARSD